MHAAGQAEALAVIREDGADVAILRVGADRPGDAEPPAVLRTDSGVQHIPVLIMTAGPTEEARCGYLEAGADAVVAANVSPDELSAHVRALMRTKTLEDDLRASREALTASLERERALLNQLRRDNAHLLTLCSTDPLTRLQNVRYFDTILEKQFKIARRYNRKLSVLVFDLDHFKVINDTFGHPSGDYVLKEFSVILKRCVRDADVVARTGGEEFSIVLPNTGRSQARRMAQRIRRMVGERKFIVYGHTIHVTTSIGRASYPEDAEVAEGPMLVYFADQALLHAKQRGRDRVVGFGQLNAEARRGLRRQYLTSCPQPVPKSRMPSVADARR